MVDGAALSSTVVEIMESGSMRESSIAFCTGFGAEGKHLPAAGRRESGPKKNVRPP